MINFKDYFDISEIKGGDFIYIYDNNYNTIFQYTCYLDKDTENKILDKLNNRVNKNFEHKFDIVDNEYISYNNNKILLVRSWGYLTGTGGCNLSSEDAIKVQSQLLEYIKNKLNE